MIMQKLKPVKAAYANILFWREAIQGGLLPLTFSDDEIDKFVPKSLRKR